MSKKPDLDELRYYEDKEIERKLITSAWNELDRFHRIRTLHHTDFQDPLCERAYLAMIAVVAESQTVDMIRVCYFLRSTGHAQDAEAADVLARYELAEAYKWATDEEFAALLRQVKKIALQRNLGRVLKSLYHYTQRADVSANQMHTRVVSELENCFAGYSDQRQAYTAYEGLTMLAEELQIREENPSTTGRLIPLGWRDLHPLVPGAVAGQTIAVLARSSMGKSAFTLQLCRHLARRAKTMIVSLEVGVVDICRRLTSQELQVPAKQLRAQDVIGFRDAVASDVNRITGKKSSTLVHLEGLNLLLDKPKYNTVEAFKRHVKMVKLAHPDLAVVAIDYAQQLARKEPTPQAEASAQLKTFALQEGLTIVEALQAPTELDQRKDTRPYASDIRFSKSWEQDADIILALWRPGFYDKSDQQDQSESWCYVRKNRDGETGDVPLFWNGATTSFRDIKQPLTPEQIDRINRAARQGNLGDDIPEKMF